MSAIEEGVLQQKTFSIEWKIKDFFGNCKNVGDSYKSPVFPILYANQITNWYIEVYPKSSTDGMDDHVSLFLDYSCESDFNIKVDYQFSIVGEEDSQDGDTVTLNHRGHYFGLPNYAEQDFIKDRDDGELFDDTLTILCELTFHQMAPDVADKFYGYEKWLTKIYDKTITYKELFESGSFTDVTFNIQNNKIHSHKAILSCRSPVFKAMFEHEMKEKKESSVDIVDVDYEVMKELFRFIYSGKVENLEKVAKDLLIAADKYSIVELKALCEKTLYENLNADNAIEYLKSSDMCDTLHLKKLVLKFVVDNLKNIVRKSNFKTLFADLNRDVVCEIMEAVADKD